MSGKVDVLKKIELILHGCFTVMPLEAGGNISQTKKKKEICSRRKLKLEAVIRAEILYFSNQGNQLIFIRKKSGSI